MLERHAQMLGFDLVELLMIAADVPGAEAANLPVHDLPSPAEAVLQADGVALRLEAAQELRPEPLERFQVPRLQRANQFVGHAFRGAYENVVEEMLNLAGDERPTRSGDRAGLRDGVPVR